MCSHGTHSPGRHATQITRITKTSLEVLGLHMGFHIVLPLVGKVFTDTAAVSPLLYRDYELFKVPGIVNIS